MLNPRGSQIDVHTCPPDLEVPFDIMCTADASVVTEATYCPISDESSPSSLGQKIGDMEIDGKN